MRFILGKGQMDSFLHFSFLRAVWLHSFPAVRCSNLQRGPDGMQWATGFQQEILLFGGFLRSLKSLGQRRQSPGWFQIMTESS